MNASLAFWSIALVNLGVILALALVGVRHMRRGEWKAHRRMMLGSVGLVGCFLVAYLVKVALVGHEDLSTWSSFHIAVLRVHEAGIAAMLGGGAWAGYRAWRFGAGLPDDDVLKPDDPEGPVRVGHRYAGRVAVGGAALAWVTAAVLLSGMFGL